jgi:hypothetical protein
MMFTRRTLIVVGAVIVSFAISWKTVVAQKQVATVNPTGCTETSKRRRCRFNSTNLQLETASSIQLSAGGKSGKVIKCGKKRVNAHFGSDAVWYGTCDGNGRDANFVRRKDPRTGRTRVYGSIVVGSDICSIAPNANDVDEITCTPETDFPPEGDPLEHHHHDDEDDFHERTRNLHFGFNPGYTNDTDRKLQNDNGSVIDVMVLWTKQAECQRANLDSNCVVTATTESNMRGLIDLAVAESNTAFALSGMLSSLRLVHAYRDETYVEPLGYGTQLSDLQGTTDGKLDDVHAKRALYGADMVQMLVSK